MECQENHGMGVIRLAYSAPKDTKNSLSDGQIRISGKVPPLLLHFRTAYGSGETLIQLQSQILQEFLYIASS